MSLKLMYITNREDVMLLAERCGIDRIFIDMETLGKEQRQPGMDTVKSSHTVTDVEKAKRVLTKSQILVRINSLWQGSQNEIDDAIRAGADIIMLPYFKTANEVREFINMVGGRARTCLLFETSDAVDNVDEILSVDGIDEIHVGINDLHLCYNKKFMFEMLSDGTVEYLCNKFKEKNIPYGFGGIARLGFGDVPAELVIAEHYRLGSSMAIVARAFCRIEPDTELSSVESMFASGLNELRDYEKKLTTQTEEFFVENQRKLYSAIAKVVERKSAVSV